MTKQPMSAARASIPGILLLVVAIALAMTSLTAPRGWADTAAEQPRFASPQQAVTALIAAVGDDTDTELLRILGPGSENLISSGDSVADRNGRTRFLQAAAENISIERTHEDLAQLIVGARDYPFPIPIVRDGESWLFDTPAGTEEILNRRIGRNELHAIEVMQVYTEAQREYASMIREDGVATFAQRLASSEGRKDGLYWDAEEDEEESPLGPLFARAATRGYESSLIEDSADPFQGYFFKILKAQGAHADGGAFDYVSDDKMIFGFALLAYPARYGVSGIMTFIVNQEGVVYEKDLGENTAMAVAAITTFDPDSSWRRYEQPATP